MLIARALKNADETQAIDMGQGAVDRTGEMFTQLFPGMKAMLVSDENTYEAAGAAVVSSLTEAGVDIIDEIRFPGRPTLYAGYENVEIIRERLRGLDNTLICSIASGTLGDLAKLASGELGRPYLNVCTAASVDGYSAFGAAITRDGFKLTRPCPAPRGLIADLDVIAQAPERLTATGYGDLIEKIPAGADWILADELGIEPIDHEVWDLVQGPLREALSNPEQIASGSPESIVGLMQAHLLSGLAMQALKSSRPASGAGHQFSHTWEMEGHGVDWEPPLSHGFKVAVGTVASCALWEEALKLDLENLDVESLVAQVRSDAQAEDQMRELLPSRIADEAASVVRAKNLDGDELRRRLETIQKKWPAIRARAEQQLVSPDQAAAMLRAAGAPDHPEKIGISLERLRETYFKAQMIRTRFTILDLLADVGLLEATVERLFSPEGYWGSRRDAVAS